MNSLTLTLLGSFQIKVNGEPIRGVASNKGRALLAYLVVEADRPHRRDVLAEMLWPNNPQGVARRSLKQALSNLRKSLGDREASFPFLLIDREEVQFNSGSDHRIDVAAFTALIKASKTDSHQSVVACTPCANQLRQAVELYRGDFLEQFSLPDSAGFEEWAVVNREALQRQMSDALRTLIRYSTHNDDYSEACEFGYQLVAFEPWNEENHRELMRLLALCGQRSAALMQYQVCRRILADELGVEPTRETAALYEQIQAGELKAPARPRHTRPQPPAFLEAEAEVVEKPTFVARERELERMDGFLQDALGGHGRIVFVTGGAGRGKTALMGEFGRQAQDKRPDLLVAGGKCNAYSGIGDPYLPFREVMDMLTGDVEAQWAAGIISREHARRLWRCLPQVVPAMLDHAPYLIDTFASGRALLSRATAVAPGGASWLDRLRESVAQKRAGADGLEQNHLFQQFTNLLHALAEEHPLLLLLDDMQWADAATISLLFHLGRRLTGNRILVVCAYRPDEMALGRDGQRHPLEKILSEFKRQFGDVWVDLGRVEEAEGRRFVEAFLETELNQLSEAFQQALYRRTEGQPLFTVELLRAMQERGELVQDEAGKWVETGALDWERLPARVEAVIGERIGRLDGELRQILSAASVEGEAFTAQVVARVQGIDERKLLRALSQELERRHRLVRGQGERRLGSQRLSRYQFAHALFQRYLYHDLSPGERRLLHGEIAAALEELHQGHTDDVVVQLAHHYTQAGDGKKAVDYLLQAGDRARKLYAYPAAIGRYQQALTFLKEQGEYERAARTLMKLGLTHHLILDYRQAHQAYQEGFALWQRAATLPPAAPPPPAPHPLRAASTDPLTLDPTMVADVISMNMINQLFSGLVEQNPEMNVVPGLAQSWQVLEGGCKYLFHLRGDVVWSDGTPVTAGDFEYAWKRALDPATGSDNASLLYDVKGAQAFHQGQLSDPEQVRVLALDDVTLAVELEQPTGHFLYLLAHPVAYSVPRHVVEKVGEAWTELENIVTNGPFRLVEWQQGQLMRFSRNPQYYGLFRGNVQQVELSLYEEWSTPLAWYEADRLDIIELWRIPLSKVDRIRQQHVGEYFLIPQLTTIYLGFDVTRSPFDDPRVRRAFVLATDKETVANETLGDDPPATGGFVPPGMPGHSPGISLPYDPEQARQLLVKAGYPDGRDFPAIDFLVPRAYASSCEVLQTQWRENLGVKVPMEAVGPFAKWIARLDQMQSHMFLAGWSADYPDPESFLRVAIRLRSGWQNKTYDRLVTKARQIMDMEDRMTLYQQADRILVEDAAIMPLTYGGFSLLAKPWLKKYPMSPTNWWMWKDVIIEPH